MNYSVAFMHDPLQVKKAVYVQIRAWLSVTNPEMMRCVLFDLRNMTPRAVFGACLLPEDATRLESRRTNEAILRE